MTKRATIRRPWPAILFASAWLLFAMTFASQLAADDSRTGRAISLFLFAAALFGAFRAYRSNTIVVTGSTLTVRRFARTYRWAWRDVRIVCATTHKNGFRGEGKLIEIRTAHCDLRLREFYWPLRGRDASKADDLVGEINRLRP